MHRFATKTRHASGREPKHFCINSAKPQHCRHKLPSERVVSNVRIQPMLTATAAVAATQFCGMMKNMVYQIPHPIGHLPNIPLPLNHGPCQICPRPWETWAPDRTAATTQPCFFLRPMQSICWSIRRCGHATTWTVSCIRLRNQVGRVPLATHPQRFCSPTAPRFDECMYVLH